MFEDLGFVELTAKQVSVWFGLGLGLAFGVLAEITRFCFRRGVVKSPDRKQALGVWLTAFAFAILSTQAAVALGFVDFADHRLYATNMQVLAIVVGGLLMGTGMVLTRGCPSRVTVLFGTGNLRAGLVALIFGIVVLSTLKGLLAPVRLGLGMMTVSPETQGFVDLPGGALVWAAILASAALVYAARSGARVRDHILAALIGVLVAVGWVGSGYVLFDEFDPIAMESLGATLPWSETTFWTVASSSIPASFGVGLIGGMIAGGFVASVAGGRFKLQGFNGGPETLRYVIGAVLMGVGGVLAGGCTVGAGLAGMSTLSFAALIAILSIAAGGAIADRVIDRRSAV